MYAGLTAKVLGARAQAVTRIEATYAQLSPLLTSHKPVVGQALLCSADVARYSLPNHRDSPCLSMQTNLPESNFNRPHYFIAFWRDFESKGRKESAKIANENVLIE